MVTSVCMWWNGSTNGFGFLSLNIFYCCRILLFQSNFIGLNRKAHSGVLMPLLPLSVLSLTQRSVWHVTSVSHCHFYLPAILCYFFTCLHPETCVHISTAHNFHACIMDFDCTIKLYLELRILMVLVRGQCKNIQRKEYVEYTVWNELQDKYETKLKGMWDFPVGMVYKGLANTDITKMFPLNWRNYL